MSVEHFIVGENSQKAEFNGHSDVHPQGCLGTVPAQLDFVYGLSIFSVSSEPLSISSVSDSAHYSINGRLESVALPKAKTLFEHLKALLKRR